MRLLVWTAWGLVACTGVVEDDGPVNISDIDEDGFSSAEGDCDDQDPTIFPGADDIVGDGIDRNCDQSDGVDADFDRDPSQASGGGDCNDEDGTINSMAEEIGWDGIDQNCDGEDQFDFDDICAGERFTCGVSTVGEIFCWGDDSDGAVSGRPLDGQWVQIDCGQEFVCAREYDNSVTCWGGDNDLVVSNTPETSASAVFAGLNHACIIQQANGLPQCWGNSDAFTGLGSVSVAIRDMALGRDYTCFTRNQGGQVACVGQTDDQPTNQQFPVVNNSEWIKLAGGDSFVCGIDNEQNMRCFAQALLTDGELDPPNDQGPYSWVDSFDDGTCAIKEATELSCWGNTSSNTVASQGFQFGQPGPEVSLFRAAMGGEHACALRNQDGEVVCWGLNTAPGRLVPDFAGYSGN